MNLILVTKENEGHWCSPENTLYIAGLKITMTLKRLPEFFMFDLMIY